MFWTHQNEFQVPTPDSPKHIWLLSIPKAHIAQLTHILFHGNSKSYIFNLLLFCFSSPNCSWENPHPHNTKTPKSTYYTNKSTSQHGNFSIPWFTKAYAIRQSNTSPLKVWTHSESTQLTHTNNHKPAKTSYAVFLLLRSFTKI